MELQFDPEIHGSDELDEKQPWAPFLCGQPISFNSSTFRGQAVLYSRQVPLPENPVQLSRSTTKQTFIRIVGRVRESVYWDELYLGGLFRKPLLASLPSNILAIGVRIARRLTSNFAISVDPTQQNKRVGDTYVGVPFLPMVECLRVTKLRGEGSAEYVASSKVLTPLVEEWNQALTKKEVMEWQHHMALHGKKHKFQGGSQDVSAWSAAEQKGRRESLRNLPRSAWPRVKIHPWQVISFEIADSALHLPEMKVQWIVGFIPIPVHLSSLVSELPFACFRVPSADGESSRVCPHRVSLDRIGECPACFVPRDKSKIFFSLYIAQSGKPKQAAHKREDPAPVGTAVATEDQQTESKGG